MNTTQNTMPFTTKYSILIVDQHAEDLHSLRKALEPEFAVNATTDTDQALDLTWEQQPDSILLTLKVDQGNSFNVCQQLKQNPATSHIPVIFVADRVCDHSQAKGIELGADDFIYKPAHATIINRRVKLHLDNAQQRNRGNQLQDMRTTVAQSRPAMFQRLCHTAKFKNDTDVHLVRMSHYAQAIALELGLDESQASLLLEASSLHDIGVVGIPDHILNKPGKLTAEEFEIIKRHPEIGAKIIGDDSSPLLSMARDIALSHHEKWDGSGYPSQLKGRQIPLPARIVALADVFDALTSSRPHKQVWSLEQTVNFIRAESGQHFDPDVVDAFFAALPVLVELRNIYHD
ncbi:MAG: two-component system response regulator [Candidatus Pelagadaptatus aseana]|uniref:HD domain-containing phosphohydrolase n=1 Tax=Candidatus Pelagadaptatus aseana TaxID=3120508 RepID=UPI0039B25A5F